MVFILPETNDPLVEIFVAERLVNGNDVNLAEGSERPCPFPVTMVPG
jgi:hypothetical protein